MMTYEKSILLVDTHEIYVGDRGQDENCTCTFQSKREQSPLISLHLSKIFMKIANDRKQMNNKFCSLSCRRVYYSNDVNFEMSDYTIFDQILSNQTLAIFYSLQSVISENDLSQMLFFRIQLKQLFKSSYG